MWMYLVSCMGSSVFEWLNGELACLAGSGLSVHTSAQ